MVDEHGSTPSQEQRTAANPPANHGDAPKHMTLDDPTMAKHFLDWVKAGLRENRIMVNRSDALLHVVKEGVLIVSPLAFKLFVRQFGLVENSEDPKEQGKRETQAATKIQKLLERSMTKEKLHRKTKNGMNIHSYLVQGDHKESKIKGWLLPLTAIYGDGPAPEPNPALMNLSGFKEKSKPKAKNPYFLGIDNT